MERDSRHEVPAFPCGLRSDLVTAVLLALVGLAFTLMSASTFASVGGHCANAFSSIPKVESDIPMNPERHVNRAGSQFALCGGGE